MSRFFDLNKKPSANDAEPKQTKPFETKFLLNHYEKVNYDKIYDLEYDYISSKFLLYTFVLFSLIGVMTILELTGVFVVFYKYKNIPYKWI